MRSIASTLRPSLVLLPVRLVTGWMFFSAFHRRVVLDTGKLDPGVAGYVGEKFNQFMPGSILGVDRLIGALLDRPDALHAFLWSFTIVEALVGVALLLGLATRLAAFGTSMLSAGILLGAGWLGPTCLDEWQIGALGIASGATLLLGGGGSPSIDAWLARVRPELFRHRFVRWVADPAPEPSPHVALSLAALTAFATLATNQVFHGGLWGDLHSDSVRPRVDVVDSRRDEEGRLRITLERPVGPETYGAFLVAVRVFDSNDALALDYGATTLGSLPQDDIDNRWLVKVRPGPHGLIVPLGARATITLPPSSATLGPGAYRIELEDVSGARWERRVQIASAAGGGTHS